MEGALLRRDYLAAMRTARRHRKAEHILDSHLALYELYEAAEGDLARLAEQYRTLEAENAEHRRQVATDKAAFELRIQAGL